MEIIANNRPHDPQLLEEGVSCLREFLETFNSRDALTWARTLHYPHVRIANNKVQVWDTPEEYADANAPTQLENSSGWSHSAWTKLELVQSDEQKMHFITYFDRYDAQGNVILTSESLYILTRENGRWGTKARSSYVGIAGNNTAF